MSVFILAACRTPMGALGGAWRQVGAAALAGALLKPLADLAPEALDEVILGHGLQAGCGPDPAGEAARQASLRPGLPAFTVNQGPASGLRAVVQAARSLQAGSGGLILAGGMDSASSAPYLLPSARWGTRMGAAPVLDALLQDGGEPLATAPTPAAVEWALRSRARHDTAQAMGLLDSERIPVVLPGPRGPVRLAADEPAQALPGLVTPGDGAAALLLASQGAPGALARIRGLTQGSGVLEAIQRLLETTGLDLATIDRFELDESQPDDLLQLLSSFPGLPQARVNVRGGALARPRPLGALGAQMVVSLAHQLRDHGLHYGIAAMAAHGSALALLLESP